MTPATQKKLNPEQLWRLLEVTRQLGRQAGLDTVLGEVIEAARTVLSAERATVFLYETATDELCSKVATGSGEIRFPADQGIAGECAKLCEILNIPDCYADPRFNRAIDRGSGYRTESLLAIPLIGVDDELVGVMQVLNKQGGAFDALDESIADALAAQCAVALQRARLIDAYVEKQKLESDLALARQIQQDLLPRELPALPGYDLAAWGKPAEETGGDIYDVIAIDGACALLILCDATGHGIGPALSVSQVRSMFRIAVLLGADLDRMVEQINNQLAQDLSDNRFITAFIGALDTAAHRVGYHAPGQAPLLHFRAADGSCTELAASGIPLGILVNAPLLPPPPIELAPGDILGLISDGIFEASNAEQEEFGVERTVDVIREHQHRPMQELIQEIHAAVDAFVGGLPQDDDMTILLARRLPE